MTKIFSFIKKHIKYIVIGLGTIVILFYFIFARGVDKREEYIVKTANVEQSVLLSGKVVTADRADLGFASSGRISKIYVKNSQAVKAEQTLSQLEIGELLADLKIKQINSQTSEVDLAGAKEELEKVIKTENTKVESAYRNLLTEDLVLIPSSDSYNVDPPIISGIYNGPEGTYKANIDKESVTSSELYLQTFNLEKTKIKIKEEGPTLFGTKGLYVSFDDDLEEYVDTIWFLEIPNKTGSSYLENFNAYNESKNERDLAIKDAELRYNKLLTEKTGNNFSSVAQAEIQKINAEIRKNTIYAPFSGRVTNIEKEVGESASIGERVISILGEKRLEVILEVSELDVSKLVPGSSIKLSLDAFPREEFVGILRTVNSRETEVDGVPVYEAFVELNPDPRIKTGMSATGTLIIASVTDVLAIPSYLVTKENNLNFVQMILPNGKLEKREVTLGLLGTDSTVEVISGLKEGERILLEKTKK